MLEAMADEGKFQEIPLNSGPTPTVNGFSAPHIMALQGRGFAKSPARAGIPVFYLADTQASANRLPARNMDFSAAELVLLTAETVAKYRDSPSATRLFSASYRMSLAVLRARRARFAFA
jgi:hypothetical protein